MIWQAPKPLAGHGVHVNRHGLTVYCRILDNRDRDRHGDGRDGMPRHGVVHVP